MKEKLSHSKSFQKINCRISMVFNVTLYYQIDKSLFSKRLYNTKRSKIVISGSDLTFIINNFRML